MIDKILSALIIISRMKNNKTCTKKKKIYAPYVLEEISHSFFCEFFFLSYFLIKLYNLTDILVIEKYIKKKIVTNQIIIINPGGPICTINHVSTNGIFRIFFSRDFAINLYKLIRLQTRKGYSTRIE